MDPDDRSGDTARSNPLHAYSALQSRRAPTPPPPFMPLPRALCSDPAAEGQYYVPSRSSHQQTSRGVRSLNPELAHSHMVPA